MYAMLLIEFKFYREWIDVNEPKKGLRYVMTRFSPVCGVMTATKEVELAEIVKLTPITMDALAFDELGTHLCQEENRRVFELMASENFGKPDLNSQTEDDLREFLAKTSAGSAG